MHRVYWIALVIPLILACTATETVEPVNQPPTIQFTFEKIATRTSVPVDLSVEVSDPDGDPLSVKWEITSGTLESQNAQNTIMRWRPPSSPGADTVVVTVSDGELSASIEEVVKRGTYFTLPVELTDYEFTKAESPWIVNTDQTTVGIAGGSTVSIEAGVEIYIEKRELAIQVNGTLEANGTESEWVRIHPNDRTIRCGEERGWWEGIRVLSDENYSGQVNLQYTEVWYGVKNVAQSSGDAVVNLKNCRMLCGRDAGVAMSGTGTVTLDRCEISNSRSHGISISSLTQLPTSVTITNCDISNNGDTGIFMDLPDHNQEVPIIIRYNLIEGNAVNGIAMTHSVWPTIENNDIWLNNFSTASNIRLSEPYPGAVSVPAEWDSLLVPGNWWGGAFEPEDIGFIEATIWDKAENPSIGTRVIVDGWENTRQYNP